MKSIISVNKGNYKTFTSLFESIKQKSERKYYHNFLITYGNDMKRTCNIIKEIIGLKKLSGNLFLKRLVVNDLEIFDQKTIAENFKFFSKIGPKLASKMPHLHISCKHFLHDDYPSLEEKPITNDGLNGALKSLKRRISSGYDEISFDVIKRISS